MQRDTQRSVGDWGKINYQGNGGMSNILWVSKEDEEWGGSRPGTGLVQAEGEIGSTNEQ